MLVAFISSDKFSKIAFFYGIKSDLIVIKSVVAIKKSLEIRPFLTIS